MGLNNDDRKGFMLRGSPRSTPVVLLPNTADVARSSIGLRKRNDRSLSNSFFAGVATVKAQQQQQQQQPEAKVVMNNNNRGGGGGGGGVPNSVAAALEVVGGWFPGIGGLGGGRGGGRGEREGGSERQADGMAINDNTDPSSPAATAEAAAVAVASPLAAAAQAASFRVTGCDHDYDENCRACVLQQQLEQALKQVEQANKQVEQANKQVEQANKQVHIINGTYFATIEDVFQLSEQKHLFTGAFEWNKLRRENPPACYHAIKALALDPESRDWNCDFADLKTQASRSTVRNSSNQMLTCPFGGRVLSRAYMVPKSGSCAAYWAVVSSWVTGLEPKDGESAKDTNARRQVATFGSATEHGVVRSPHNLIGLPCENHKGIFDTLTEGVLAIIPILTMSQVINWQDGDHFDVLVLGCSSSTYLQLQPGRWTVCENVNNLPCANEEDIETVACLMKEGFLVFADALHSDVDDYRDAIRSHFQTKLDNANSDVWRDFEKNQSMLDQIFSYLDGEKERGISVPIAKTNIGKEVLKLRVPFNDAQDAVTTDPCLLLSKAVTNIFYYFMKKEQNKEWKLLPGCHSVQGDDDDDDYDDEANVFRDILPPARQGKDEDLSATHNKGDDDRPCPADITLGGLPDDDELSVMTDDSS